MLAVEGLAAEYLTNYDALVRAHEQPLALRALVSSCSPGA